MKFSYIVVAVVIIVLSLAGYLLFRSRNTNINTNGGEFATGQEQGLVPLDTAAIPADDKIAIGTPHGTVSVSNFYKVAQGWSGDESSVLIIHSTPEYQAYYDTEGSAFGIYIVGGQVESARKAAEADLVNILGISPTQVCYLNVSWSVSAGVDQGLSGRSYPLSFCVPGAQ